MWRWTKWCERNVNIIHQLHRYHTATSSIVHFQPEIKNQWQIEFTIFISGLYRLSAVQFGANFLKPEPRGSGLNWVHLGLLAWKVFKTKFNKQDLQKTFTHLRFDSGSPTMDICCILNLNPSFSAGVNLVQEIYAQNHGQSSSIYVSIYYLNWNFVLIWMLSTVFKSNPNWLRYNTFGGGITSLVGSGPLLCMTCYSSCCGC